MVTSETNRTQTSPAATFERPPHAVGQPAETVAESAGEETCLLPSRHPVRFMSLVVSEATEASLFGLGAFVLGILGLSGVVPVPMLAIAGLLVGAALMAVSAMGLAWAYAVRFSDLETRRERMAFTAGMIGTSLAGIAGLVLGIMNLSLFGSARMGGVTAVVLGAGLLLQAGVSARVSRLCSRGQRLTGPFAVNALSLGPVRDFVVGLGSIVLGVLAAAGLVPATMTLVAMLALGLAVTATAITICGATVTTVESS